MTENFDPNHFFDSFSEFYKKNVIGRHKLSGEPPSRLNCRYLGLIDAYKEYIQNSSILDIACMDGRWSFAAIKNDAKKVLGIEGREESVKYCYENMEKYNIPKEKYSFIVGDIFDEIIKLKPGQFDTIFCFGFLYHTPNPWGLLSEIKHLEPKYVIIDTHIARVKGPFIRLREENTEKKRAAISNKKNPQKTTVVGSPTIAALNMMLKNLGFDFKYFDWENSGLATIDGMQEYAEKKRITLVAKNLF